MRPLVASRTDSSSSIMLITGAFSNSLFLVVREVASAAEIRHCPWASLVYRKWSGKLYLGIRRKNSSHSAHTECIRHAHKFCEGFCPHLSHDIAAMNLHGDLADADFAGDLFVHQAGRDEPHDFLFARCQ